jgi:hypothetical protein
MHISECSEFFSLQLNSDSVHACLGMAMHISVLTSVWFGLNSFFLFLTAAAAATGEG